MHDVLNPFYNTFPHVIGAILILIIGLIVAAILSALVRGVLQRTGLGQRIATRVFGRERAATMDIASGVGRAVYYLVLIFVAIAVLNALGLAIVTQPLTAFLNTLLSYLPRLIGAILLFVVAWLLATILRAIVLQALRALHVDERLARNSATAPAAGEAGESSFSRTASEVVYYLVFLFFLPAILGALGLAGLLAPVQSLVTIVLNFLPRLISAAIILVIGIFVARIVRRLVADLLAAAGVDRFSERIGLGAAAGGMRMSALLGLVVYVLMLIPVLTASLDALQLGAVTQPISNMLNRILLALPNIFAAAVLLAIAYAVSRVVANIVTSVLTGFGFNRLVAQLGFGQTATVTTAESRTPAGYIGTLAQLIILFFAAIEALQLLGFTFVATLISQFVQLAGHIILGLIIFAIGVFIARWAAGAVRGSGVAQAGLLAFVAQAAILVLAGAMALRQMGVADDIINLAFGLLLGAVAVATAIAFGVGGREVAGRELARWVDAARQETLPAPAPPPPPALPGAGSGGEMTK
ncbi:MAG TPA: mechanosensitive ion channel [Thermomicrobiales bacterium]|nr:mechanosensitive ion channel [Thermomicrobiales bacterium]